MNSFNKYVSSILRLQLTVHAHEGGNWVPNCLATTIYTRKVPDEHELVSKYMQSAVPSAEDKTSTEYLQKRVNNVVMN